jgi:hypothetical protein
VLLVLLVFRFTRLARFGNLGIATSVWRGGAIGRIRPTLFPFTWQTISEGEREDVLGPLFSSIISSLIYFSICAPLLMDTLTATFDRAIVYRPGPPGGDDARFMPAPSDESTISANRLASYWRR